MKNKLYLIVAILLTAICFPGCSNSSHTSPEPEPEPVNLRKIFKTPDFTFQLIRTAGASPYGAADMDECVQTAYKITDGDIESWYREWYALAEEVKISGELNEQFGNIAAARQAYLRASNYYRNSGFFLSEKPMDPRIKDTWKKSFDTFSKASSMFSPPFEYVKIPYENTYIPAYFYRGQSNDKRLPTVIMHQGFDGTKEETVPGGLVSQMHGYNCLIFDGPGQGEMIHDMGIPFRPDWENVVGPVIDYLLTRDDVNPEKIVLIGFSMGGYLAPRASTADHRLAAVVANGGLYSVFEGSAMHWIVVPGFPETVPEFLEFIQTYPDEFNEIAYEMMEYSLSVKWSLVHGMYTFGVETPAEYFIQMSYMTLDDRVQNISCPVLVIDSENDTSFPGQPKKLYDSLVCEKEFLMFTEEEGADLHCQAGAAPVSWQKTFEWIDKILNR